jgi:hypothetical protein
MAFQHGKSTGVLFDEFNFSSYFNAVSASRQIQVVNTTTFGNDNKTYIPGIEEGSLSIQGLWDGAAAAVDAEFDAAIGSEGVFTICPEGFATVGNRAIMMKAENVQYDIRSTVSDAVRIVLGGTADGGVRMAGRLLQDLAAETTTFNGTNVDNTTSTAFGGVAHLHVTAFSGTSGVMKVQHSPDNSAWADLVTFTTVTGVGVQRSVVAGTTTVDRHLRFAITADTFTSMTVACAFARNRS